MIRIKNFILVLFVLINLFLPIYADMLALSSKSINYYGVGVVNAPGNYKVYQYPYKESKVIREINYDKMRETAIVNSSDLKKVSYISYIPTSNIALLAVEMDNGDGWYNVYLNQKTGETGWIYTGNTNSFLTYKSLFYKYGKKYGVRMFNDLPKEKRVLYAKESADSKVLEQLTYPDNINFTVIRGNWMLAIVSDLSKQAKVGWFNWRNDDGSLNMFPNFKD